MVQVLRWDRICCRRGGAVEDVEQRKRATGRERHDHTVHEPGGVGDRGRHEDVVVAPDGKGLRQCPLAEQDRVVGMHGALRPRFGARGEEHGDRIVGRDRRQGGGRLVGSDGGEWHTDVVLALADTDDDDLVRKLRLQRDDRGSEIRAAEATGNEQRGAPAFAQDIAQVGAPVCRRHGVDDGTDLHHREEHDHGLPPVGKAHGDDVALADAAAREEARHRVRLAIERRVRQARAGSVPHRDLFRRRLRRLPEELRNRVVPPLACGPIEARPRGNGLRKWHHAAPDFGRPASWL